MTPVEQMNITHVVPTTTCGNNSHIFSAHRSTMLLLIFVLNRNAHGIHDTLIIIHMVACHRTVPVQEQCAHNRLANVDRGCTWRDVLQCFVHDVNNPSDVISAFISLSTASAPSPLLLLLSSVLGSITTHFVNTFTLNTHRHTETPCTQTHPLNTDTQTPLEHRGTYTLNRHTQCVSFEKCQHHVIPPCSSNPKTGTFGPNPQRQSFSGVCMFKGVCLCLCSKMCVCGLSDSKERDKKTERQTRQETGREETSERTNGRKMNVFSKIFTCVYMLTCTCMFAGVCTCKSMCVSIYMCNCDMRHVLNKYYCFPQVLNTIIFYS